MAEADIPAHQPLSKDAVPDRMPSYEEQLATVESLMTCYDIPLTQAAAEIPRIPLRVGTLELL
jgi:hypothetical protein